MVPRADTSALSDLSHSHIARHGICRASPRCALINFPCEAFGRLTLFCARTTYSSMSASTDLSRGQKAGRGLGAPPCRLGLRSLVLMLALLMVGSGPLSLAHATLHHVSIADSHDSGLPGERLYATAGQAVGSDSAEALPLSPPVSPEQAFLEQNCVVCQLLQAAPARALHPTARHVQAAVAYVMPFDSEEADLGPPPLLRPPRS